MNQKQKYLIGMDVGSTTTKIVVLRQSDEEIVYSEYARHHAELARSVCTLLEHGKEAIPAGSSLQIAFTGSGSKPLADAAELCDKLGRLCDRVIGFCIFVEGLDQLRIFKIVPAIFAEISVLGGIFFQIVVKIAIFVHVILPF